MTINWRLETFEAELFPSLVYKNMANVLTSLKNRFTLPTFSSDPSSRKPNSPPPSYLETLQRPPASPTVNHQIVGQTFFPLLLPMKWTGMCPLTIQNCGTFYGIPTFATLLYALLCSASITVCVTVYTLNRGFDISWPFRVWAPLKPQELFDSPPGTRPPPNFFIWVTLGLQIMIPVTSLIYGHFGLYHISKFCSFLNQWSIYSKNFDLYFSPFSYSIDFSDLRRYRKYYAIAYIPALFLCILLVPFMSRTKVLQIAVSDGIVSILSTVITIFWVEGLIAIRIVFSMKDFMILNALEVGYRELRKGIEAQYNILNGKVNRGQVRNWLKMVAFVRNQRSLVEKHMGLQNNWLLVEIFVVTLLVLTASILVIMNEINEYLGWVTTYVGISAALLFFLFFKAHLAERISEQEEMLAESIVGMTGCDDSDTRLEMKSICDLIFHDPIKISLGYVFVLNKRLMLAFCSQLAASLVILLQFVNH